MIRKNTNGFEIVRKLENNLKKNGQFWEDLLYVLKDIDPAQRALDQRVDKLSHLPQFCLIDICVFGEPRPSKMAWHVFLRQNKNESLRLVVHNDVDVSFCKGRVQVLAGLQSQNFSKWQFSFMSKSTQLLGPFHHSLPFFLSRKKNVLKQYRVVAVVKQTNTTAEP